MKKMLKIKNSFWDKAEYQKFLKGFTLFEILIVISIIVLLALLGVPAIRAFQPTLRLSGDTQEMVGDLRQAQQLTVTEQQGYCVNIFPAEKRYVLKKCDDSEIIKEKIFSSDMESVSVTGLDGDEVRYNPYGAVSQAGDITLTNTKSETKKIEIKASGFVTVSD